MRVAIVHEKFTIYAGSERVVEQLHLLWPDAPIFTTVCDPETLGPILCNADVRTSPLQRLYRSGDHYAHLLPLLPLAISRLAVGDFDLVITSHHAFANRVRPGPGVPIVGYVHTPARWMWEPGTRRHEIGGAAGRGLLGAFAATQRGPDRRAARRLSGVVANSHHVADRIRRWWGRDATVVSPPVNTAFYTPGASGSAARGDFYLVAGRLVPYKRPDLAVAAASRAGVKLIVAGDGRARSAVEAAAGPTVEILGRVDDDTLRDLYRSCRALLFPGEEDFGIMPAEAQACGAPVIARAVGGVLDVVLPGTTGVLYPATTDTDHVETLARVLRDFADDDFDRSVIRAHAERFAPEHFRAGFATAVADATSGSGSGAGAGAA
jgi:glycosyltransferase involved in cell wall biosynthesis